MNGVSTPDLVSRDRDADGLHATALAVEAMTASRMTPATISGWDNMSRWEPPSTSVTFEPARS